MSKPAKKTANSTSDSSKKSTKKPAAKKDDQLQSISEFDNNNIIFSDVVESNIPGSKMTFKRISISTKNSDETVGGLIVPTERVFCFGVTENRDNTTKKLGGYSMNVALWDRDGATEEQKAWTDWFTDICSYIRNYLIKNADSDAVQLYDKKEKVGIFNPMFWKKDKGVIVEGTGPTLYIKLLSGYPKKKGSKGKKGEEKEEVRNEEDMKIFTEFFDKDTAEPIDPKSLIGSYFYARASMHIESIYIGGNNVTLQLKAREVEVERLQTQKKQLLARPKPIARVLTAGNATNLNELKTSDEDEAETTHVKKTKKSPAKAGSVQNSDAEDNEEAPKEEEPKEVKKKTVVKKIVKKVVKKSDD